jgi:Domain of unknown function (DUF5679)
MKCREQVKMQDGKYLAKNGRPFFVGKCPKCHGDVWRIVSADDAAKHGVKVEKKSKSRKGGYSEPAVAEGGKRRKSKSRKSKSKSKSKSRSKGGRKSRK